MKLEEKLEMYKKMKNLLISSNGIQCKVRFLIIKMCNKIYSYELYKSHTEICKVELKPVIKQHGEKMDSDKNKNLKIKVLQGILCQDENMKPYIEYILEISLNKPCNFFCLLVRVLIQISNKRPLKLRECCDLLAYS